MQWLKTNTLWLFLSGYAIFAIVVMSLFNGTGDSGDSILHFLFAQSAPSHPELYLNHWAKPAFTLLASPFAQFGFLGIKVFNSLVVLLMLYFTYKSAEKLQLKRPVFVLLFIACAPLLIRHTFSGLTEPLFALFIAWGMYLIVHKKWLWACIIISFLPFVRSEGLIVITAFGLLLLVRKQWKYIPWLLFGHVAYSIAGAFYFKDILWVFTKIPYATVNSVYGKGELLHFVDQLPFVIGIPSMALLVVGIISLMVKLLRKQWHPELHALILYGFLSYFIAHSLFWYLGIFNSMGLNRVLLGVMPFMAIIALEGTNTLAGRIRNKKGARLLTFLMAGLILVFPLTNNPSAVHWQRDMNLSGEQKVAQDAAQFIIKQDAADQRLMYLPPYLSMALEVDHFDPKAHRDLHPLLLQHVKKGEYIIWDNWFSVVDGQVTSEMIENFGKFELVESFRGKQEDREVIYRVYRAK